MSYTTHACRCDPSGLNNLLDRHTALDQVEPLVQPTFNTPEFKDELLYARDHE